MAAILKLFLVTHILGWSFQARTQPLLNDVEAQYFCGELKHMELTVEDPDSGRAQIYSEVSEVGPTLVVSDYRAVERMLDAIPGVIRTAFRGVHRYWTANAVMDEKYLVCFYGYREGEIQWGARQVPAFVNIRYLRVISRGEVLLQYFAPWAD